MNSLASRPGQPGMLPVGEKTIRRWVDAGEFPAPIQLGGTKVWDSAWVSEFVRKKRLAADAPLHQKDPDDESPSSPSPRSPIRSG